MALELLIIAASVLGVTIVLTFVLHFLNRCIRRSRYPTLLSDFEHRFSWATLESRLEQALRMQAAALVPPPPPPAGREEAVTPAASGALEASLVGKGVLQAERGLAAAVQMVGSMARFAGQRSRTAAGAAYVEADSKGGSESRSGGAPSRPTGIATRRSTTSAGATPRGKRRPARACSGARLGRRARACAACSMLPARRARER